MKPDSLVHDPGMDIASNRIEDMLVALFGLDPQDVEVTADDDGRLVTLKARWPSDE